MVKKIYLDLESIRIQQLITTLIIFAAIFMIIVPLCNVSGSGHQDYRKYFKSSRIPVRNWVDLKNVLTNTNKNPVSYMTTPQVLMYYGYPVETHKVTTGDGYILTMHRIPFGNNTRKSREKTPVVFLQHGLFASSFEWLMNKKENLLPLKLSDAGYDVWFGNSRGNAYSREHVRLNVKSSQFWKFSMNEMGKYDIPAEIDYVLTKSGESTLSYVGFSMGTTMFFIMMSHHPEYNAKVKLMTALAPVVYINNMQGMPRMLMVLEAIPQIRDLVQIITNGEFLPPWITQMYNTLGTRFCSNTFIAETFCTNINFLYAGWDLPQVSIDNIPVFYAHTPSPTSVRTTLHILQFIKTGIFQEFDFGKTENYRKYKKSSPPLYSLKNTSVPVALLWGQNDGVVNPVDVKRLAAELPRVVLNSPINFTYWNHFDYHLGKDANNLVNERILELLAMY